MVGSLDGLVEFTHEVGTPVLRKEQWRKRDPPVFYWEVNTTTTTSTWEGRCEFDGDVQRIEILGSRLETAQPKGPKMEVVGPQGAGLVTPPFERVCPRRETRDCGTQFDPRDFRQPGLVGSQVADGSRIPVGVENRLPEGTGSRGGGGSSSGSKSKSGSKLVVTDASPASIAGTEEAQFGNGLQEVRTVVCNLDDPGPGPGRRKREPEPPFEPIPWGERPVRLVTSVPSYEFTPLMANRCGL